MYSAKEQACFFSFLILQVKPPFRRQIYRSTLIGSKTDGPFLGFDNRVGFRQSKVDQVGSHSLRSLTPKIKRAMSVSIANQ